ncbi:MAG TPA: hypothetical protein DDW41_02050 [Candidatus Andersenbacteria bacterium]|nr:hypothetical protein [Candidatus Andersenbacteria bacterium]
MNDIQEAKLIVEKPTQAQQLMNLASEAELFRGDDSTDYGRFKEQGHFETWPLKSNPFKDWLRRGFYQIHHKPPGSQALQDAIGMLEAQTKETKKVFIRVGQLDNKIYLDLANPKWQVVEVSAEGWSVINNPPVVFRRTKGMMALPLPAKGDIEELRRFLNVDDDSWRLVKAYLAGCLNPSTPYPILIVYGEPGSAKSTLAWTLKSLIDPTLAPLRSAPKEERDLVISATNGWVMSYDNLSFMTQWLSDAFCRLSTGGGLATRSLYKDAEEQIFDVRRPVMFTCVTQVAGQSDLLDRSITISLEAIPDDERLEEKVFLERFSEVKPQILGGLLDSTSRALRETFILPKLPRMADFAIWAARGSNESMAFMNAYELNQAERNEMALDFSPIAKPLMELVEGVSWEGTAEELLDQLSGRVEDKVRKAKYWPNNARALSGQLTRVAPNLRAVGITIKKKRTNKQRVLLISYISEETVTQSDANDGRHPILSNEEEESIRYNRKTPSLPSLPSLEECQHTSFIETEYGERCANPNCQIFKEQL